MLNQKQIYGGESLYWSLAALIKTVGEFALRRYGTIKACQ